MNLSYTIRARLADAVQLTYRTPADSVAGLLPEGLELVRRGPWAFWSVMLNRVEKARPDGVPAWCGISYAQVAYRLMAQAMNSRAEVVRGLYFVRSDVDARAVSLLGNKLGDLKMHNAAVELDADDCGVSCRVSNTAYRRADMVIEAAHAPAHLVDGSCFPTIEAARRFCAFTPTSLSVDQIDGQRRLQITRVEREQTTHAQTPVVLRQARLAYFDSIGQGELAELEWACRHGEKQVRVQVGESIPLLSQPQLTNTIERVAI